MPEQKPSWIPGALLAAPLVLSTPAFGQDAVPVSEFTDRQLLDDRVMVRGEVRGVPGLFVDVPDLEPVAKHDQNFVYFNAIAEDGKTPICFGVDHLLPVSEGVWRLDLETARISSTNVDCVTLLNEAGQAYDPVVVEEDVSAKPSWIKNSHFGLLVGPYAESYDMYTPGVNPDFRLIAGMPLGHSPWMIGGTTNFYMPVAEMERSGLGRVGGVLGRNFKFPVADMDLLLTMQGGWSKDYNPHLDALYAGLGATVNLADFDAIHTSLVADMLVTHDFIGNGWFLTGDLGLAYTASVGLTFKPAMFLPERDERVKPAKDLVIAVERKPEAEDLSNFDDQVLIKEKGRSYSRRITEGFPEFDYPVEIDRDLKQSLPEKDQIKIGDIERIEDDIRKAMTALEGRPNYKAVEDYVFKAFVWGKDYGIDLIPAVYEAGYYMARDKSDMALARAFLKASISKYPEDTDKDLYDSLNYIENYYGWVDLKGAELLGSYPFAPSDRRAIELVESIIAETGEYQGLLYLSDYTLDDIPFKPESLSGDGQNHGRVTVVRP